MTADTPSPSERNAVVRLLQDIHAQLAYYDYLLPGDFVPDPPWRKRWFRWGPAFKVTDDLIIWAGQIARERSLMDLKSAAEQVADLIERPSSPRSSTVDEATVEAVARRKIINTPETTDFMAGVPIEAAHQRERWGSEHDAGKTPFDWFWLVGYLAQKAATAAVAGDTEKAKHHTISTAGALANWHAQLSGKSNQMRPGIEEPRDVAA